MKYSVIATIVLGIATGFAIAIAIALLEPSAPFACLTPLNKAMLCQ